MRLRRKSYKVTRAQIVAAARQAIELAREREEISTALVRRLMKVARTAPEFALGDWYIDRRCGCLIGNLHGRPIDVEALSMDQYRVGMAFDAALNTVTNHYGNYPHRGAIVKVID